MREFKQIKKVMRLETLGGGGDERTGRKLK